MTLSYDEDNSRNARLKRALMHPSKRTWLSYLVVLLLVTAPLTTTWISTALEGISEVTEDHDLETASKLPTEDLADEQVLPWLIEQGETMIAATTPLQWEIANFYFGPCSTKNIAEMEAGAAHITAVTEGCASMADIRGKYGRDCFVAATCEVKQAAKDDLAAVIDDLWVAYDAAGYARP
jgi:hypothetical protein